MLSSVLDLSDDYSGNLYLEVSACSPRSATLLIKQLPGVVRPPDARAVPLMRNLLAMCDTVVFCIPIRYFNKIESYILLSGGVSLQRPQQVS